MKERTAPRKATPAGEPVGIVISRGRETESAPLFSAYMYAPDPDDVVAPVPELAGV
jgi:hypothetical protein